MNDSIDVETWLLRILDVSDAEEAHLPNFVSDGAGDVWRSLPVEDALRSVGVRIPPPRDLWLVQDGAIGGDRLFTDDPGLLLNRTVKLCDQRRDIVFLRPDNTVRLAQWVPLGVGLRGVAAIPGWKFGLMTQRDVTPSGKSDLIANLAMYRGFEIRPAIFKSLRVSRSSALPEELRNTQTLGLSLLEDFLLPQWWHVRVASKAGASFRLPVTPHACQDLLRFRDGPLTDRGNRRRLLHWVREHTRRRRDTTYTVKPFLRGVTRVDVDDDIYAEIDPRQDAEVCRAAPPGSR